MSYSDIESKPIQELCRIIDCEHKTAPYVVESEFLVVRTSNVRDGQLLMDDMKYTTRSGYDEWTQRATPEYGDVLFTREAPAGESCLVPSDKKVCMGQRMVLLRPNRQKVDPIFLSLMLTTETCKFNISRLSIGSTVSRINIADIKNLKVVVPPLSEQKIIAQILSTWDKAIKSTDHLLANCRQQKKAMMQLFLTGKKRLLDKDGVRFSGEWQSVKVSDILEVRKEKQVPTNNTPLYSLTIEQGITPKSDRYNREFLVKNTDDKKYKIVRPKDIVYNPANLRWGAINYSRLEHSVVVSPIYEVLYVEDESLTSLEFVAQKLMTTDQINRFASMVEGTLMERMAVKIKPFLATKLSIPPTLEEQKKISSVLSAADQEINILKQKIAYLKQERKALMQQLLTGKKRVKVEPTGH